METIQTLKPTLLQQLISRIRSIYDSVPMVGWLLGMLCAVIVEHVAGNALAYALYLSKMPALFGITIVLKQPQLFPAALLYVIVIYVLPIALVSAFTAPLTDRMATILDKKPLWFSALLHLALLYLVLHIWTGLSDYRLQVTKLVMIAVMLTLSINVINGYMGEFSCSHPGFVALGAYTASTITLMLFTKSRFFGDPLLPAAIGPFMFPAALVLGGVIAALGVLVVAIPSFRTRGDYLAIISLAFMFIVKSVLENLELLGGPRGMGGQPHWSTLPAVFISMAVCIWVINNFVSSIMGKALNAVRDNETAADAMTVDTRRTKMIAFMFGAFWAGVAGGLYAHELRYVNPSGFGIQMLAEILAMVYFGGLNSVVGSIVGAVSIQMLSEALRPLELFKWIIIPLVLILVMIFRPTGLIAFRDFNVKQILSPKRRSG